MMATPARVSAVTLLLLGLAVAVLLLCLALGTVSVPLGDLVSWLTGGELGDTHRLILARLRLPRLVMAGLMGCSLSISGVVLQGVLRNPLAEPFILGVSGGAASGAVTALALGMSSLWFISSAAFVGALITVFLVMVLARRQGRRDTATLVLTGVMVNAFCTALIMFFISTVSENKVHAIMFWLYGDLSEASLMQVRILAPAVISGSLVLLYHARQLNLLSAGDLAAASLGVDTERLKVVLFTVIGVLVGVTVSLCGLVGFVGLMVPHLVRISLGHDNRLVLPAAALFGASFLMAADTVARIVISPAQIPVGVVTAALGAPFFVMLLARRGSQWW